MAHILTVSSLMKRDIKLLPYFFFFFLSTGVLWRLWVAPSHKMTDVCDSTYHHPRILAIPLVSWQRDMKQAAGHSCTHTSLSLYFWGRARRTCNSEQKLCNYDAKSTSANHKPTADLFCCFSTSLYYLLHINCLLLVYYIKMSKVSTERFRRNVCFSLSGRKNLHRRQLLITVFSHLIIFKTDRQTDSKKVNLH